MLPKSPNNLESNESVINQKFLTCVIAWRKIADSYDFETIPQASNLPNKTSLASMCMIEFSTISIVIASSKMGCCNIVMLSQDLFTSCSRPISSSDIYHHILIMTYLLPMKPESSLLRQKFQFPLTDSSEHARKTILKLGIINEFNQSKPTYRLVHPVSPTGFRDTFQLNVSRSWDARDGVPEFLKFKQSLRTTPKPWPNSVFSER